VLKLILVEVISKPADLISKTRKIKIFRGRMIREPKSRDSLGKAGFEKRKPAKSEFPSLTGFLFYP
jgi:hypothetical protein